MSQEEWEAEKAFWADPRRPKMFCLETVGRAYMQYEAMVEQEYLGEWVRAEDYRRDVEALEKQVAELKDRLTDHFPHCGSE